MAKGRVGVDETDVEDEWRRVVPGREHENGGGERGNRPARRSKETGESGDDGRRGRRGPKGGT